jgi:hypothetical protein
MQPRRHTFVIKAMPQVQESNNVCVHSGNPEVCMMPLRTLTLRGSSCTCADGKPTLGCVRMPGDGLEPAASGDPSLRLMR